MTDSIRELRPEPEPDASTRAYLRARADVPVPAPGDLLAPARDAALRPGLRWPRSLAPAMAAAAGVAALAFAGSLWLRPAATAPAGALEDTCPVTVPAAAFVPPPPYLPQPPAIYGSDWYGTADLWTMLSRDGEVWHDLPTSRSGFSQKTWWWSVNYSGGSREPAPSISVTGLRLDDPASAPVELADRGTNGYADFGDAMLVGVDMPSTGCWQLTATYKGNTLSYVVEVR